MLLQLVVGLKCNTMSCPGSVDDFGCRDGSVRVDWGGRWRHTQSTSLLIFRSHHHTHHPPMYIDEK